MITKSSTAMPPWTSFTLKVAAVYNLLWGAFVVLYPQVPFQWLGIEPPNYPSLVQCLGMVIGVYGIGYWIAASDPAIHWPIVVVGLLGKIFGPIGFVYAASIHELPWKMGLTILTNDVAWWLPFSGILIHAARVHEARRAAAEGLTLEQVLRSSVTQTGQNLFELSLQSPLLVICIRHLGCTFCRETLADFANRRADLQREGLLPVIVSMAASEPTSALLSRYGLSDVVQVSDPERRLHRALELPFGTMRQLFGWSAFWRTLGHGTVFRFGFGRVVGNALQLSGTFVIKNGQILQAIRHKSSSERTDFNTLACDLS